VTTLSREQMERDVAGDSTLVEVLRAEKARLADTQLAVLNILEDAAEERTRLADIQRAMLNILEDFDDERAKAERGNIELRNEIAERLEAQAEQERLRVEAERQRVENRLQQSQRLESLGQLAGGVAHDFNNLLGVILIYTTLVAEEVAGASRGAGGERWEAVRSDVERIRQAADRATALTRQLLAFGRREVVHPQVIDLSAVAAGIEELLRRTIGEHVELVARLRPDVWPVLADAGQIEQVLVNLAVNARDAMPGGGTLTVDTDNIVVSEAMAASRPGARPGRHVRMRVGDTGSGMDPYVLDHAVEPFFTTKPKGEGTGLGLATVYGIVTQSGGFLQISSTPSSGTQVSAYLPATDRVPTEPAPVPDEPAHAGGGRTVLVVEDEEAIREVTARILARSGFAVLTAAGGAEAIRAVEEHPGAIDLLLTDVVMPHMTGKEVAEALTTRIAGLRVLYMSGYAHPALTSQGTLDAGVTLIEKPFSEPQLLAKIRDVLDGG
jgi:signal transduction histidine kinase